MHTNFLVIGSGISGLNFALNAAQKGKVLLITKKHLLDANTNYAQGGIAAVLGQTDDIEKHIKDTLSAGAYHNNRRAVRFMVTHSAQAIYRLLALGVPFEKEKGRLKLSREGGHGLHRIAFVGDRTGAEIEKTLIANVKKNPNIQILENTTATKLLVKNKICYGVSTLKENIYADQTILATGGLGQIFKFTTNPKIATGDGLAMAIQAGCKTKDLEFIQFHPTALAKPLSPLFLISEAVRGEGAKLVNSKGKRFADELASRDIVAREIYREQKTGPVYIDIRHKNKKFLQKRFPQIFAKLKSLGIDMSKDLIPVTPAAHYSCGGIVTDLHGRTSVKNLFAFGEVACTGVHGANRLASNSLLEALVFSNQIIKKLKPSSKSHPKFPFSKSQNDLSHQKQIQELMWKYCGIIRNPKEIKTIAIPKIKKLLASSKQNNLAIVALSILTSASKRKKSLGCHFTFQAPSFFSQPAHPSCAQSRDARDKAVP